MNLKRTLSLLLCLAFALGMFATCGAAAPEATEEPAAAAGANPFAAAIVTDDGLEEADLSSGKIYGGTNQNDAVLLPLNTKLYGTAAEDALWYAFTTLSDPNASYYITLLNKTPDGSDVSISIYDQNGKIVPFNYHSNNSFSSAGRGGRAVTIYPSDNLSPDTTYYVYIWAESGTVDYRLSITPQNVTADGYTTTDNILDARKDASAAEGLIAPGTNMDEAGYLPLNAKITASISNYHNLWFAFTTNETEGDYSISMVNETVGSKDISVSAYNQYGMLAKANYQYNSSFSSASSDGKVYSLKFESLSPNTTYYLQLWTDSESPVQYTLIINAPEAPATPAPATVEPLIFETPFELNETRVMFVGDEATFIDETAAREACAPVADVILAHPDHQVLLVGTTASNGSDEYCLDLSSRRAAAVKDLLVNAYGVPEDQLLSVGLGYKLDPFARANDLDANGKLIESEACKNRRVIVLDAEDPIAQEILASNG